MKTFIPETFLIANPNQALPAHCTFSRNCSAYRTNAQGILELIGANQPRHDYDPMTGEYLGILIEDKVTNLAKPLTTSSFWTYAGTTKTNIVPDIIAPDGTSDDPETGISTVVKLCEKAQTSAHWIAGDSGPYELPHFIPGGYFTFSFFVRAAERSEIQINLQNFYGATHGQNSQVYAQLNVKTGNVILAPTFYKNSYISNGITLSVFANPYLRIISYPNGWKRVCFTVNVLSNGGIYNSFYTTRIRPIIYLLNNDLGNRLSAYPGVLDAGMHFWGMQIEYGDSATSYIPTTSAAVTRLADDFSIDLGAYFSHSEGTILTEFDINAFVKPRALPLMDSLKYPGDRAYNTIFNLHDRTNPFCRIVSRISPESIMSKIVMNVDNGIATSSGFDIISNVNIYTLTDSTKNWVDNQWYRAKLKITSGIGIGCRALIRENSNDTLTFTDFTFKADKTTQYIISTNGFYGTATGGTATTLVDSTQNWETGTILCRWQVRIIAGTGVGRQMQILSNTATSLTYADPGFVVDTTSEYMIIQDLGNPTWGVTGTATSGTATTLIDSSKNWTVNIFKNRIVRVFAGTGSVCDMKILSNDTNSLTYAAPGFVVNNTSQYMIIDEQSSPSTITNFGLVDFSKSWVTNQFIDAKIRIVSGTGTGCEAIITSNNTNTLSYRALTFKADSTTHYQIEAEQLDVIDSEVNIDAKRYLFAFAYDKNHASLVHDGGRVIEYHSIINDDLIVDPLLSFNYKFKNDIWGTSTDSMVNQDYATPSWEQDNVIIDGTNIIQTNNVILSRVTESSTTSTHSLYNNSNFAVSAATSYTLQFLIKYAGRAYIGIFLNIAQKGHYINTITGAVGTHIVGAPTSCTTKKFANSDDIYLVTLQFQSHATTAAENIRVYLHNDNSPPSTAGGASYLGDVAKGVYISPMHLTVTSNIDYNAILDAYYLNGHFRKFYYYKMALSNAKIKELTT